MKAKGPAAAKVEEEKKKGLALFGPKPPTPKLLRAIGGTINKTFIDKVKVTTPFCPNKCTPSDYYMKVIVLILSLCLSPFIVSPECQYQLIRSMESFFFF